MQVTNKMILLLVLLRFFFKSFAVSQSVAVKTGT
jgi:hypothetical protein